MKQSFFKYQKGFLENIFSPQSNFPSNITVQNSKHRFLSAFNILVPASTATSVLFIMIIGILFNNRICVLS
jgi:hypothetical protein